MTNKKYQVIYADPPWSYGDKGFGKRPDKSQSSNFNPNAGRYGTMKLADIKKFPVDGLADKDCCLFMWATSPLLPEALEVMKSWGFKFKTVAFCWNKKTNNGLDVSNLGQWTMGNVEIVLLGVKGHPKRVIKNIKQLVTAERTRHSAKPTEVRDRIVQLMGDLPRIELFAREKTEGWDVWGNEVESDIEL